MNRPRHKRALRITWTVLCGVACVLQLSYSGCERSPNTREFTTKAGMTFFGDKTSSGTIYYGVRFARKSGNEQPAWVGNRFKIGDKLFEFGAITPKDIVDSGGNAVPPSVSGVTDGTTGAFKGWGEQNRDGGVGFSFRDGSLVDCWLHWHKAEPSPFSISPESGPWVTFPVDEASLQKSFGTPANVRDYVTY
jgi:hypothetical protein